MIWISNGFPFSNDLKCLNSIAFFFLQWFSPSFVQMISVVVPVTSVHLSAGDAGQAPMLLEIPFTDKALPRMGGLFLYMGMDQYL